MFLKFVNYPCEGRGATDTTSEQMVECVDYCQYYKGEDGKYVEFDIFDTNRHLLQTITIDCSKTVVYVMSDGGKTIDSYRWKVSQETSRYIRM